ncbi:DUF4214 domain-containing protein [Mesorhizobium sp. A556]
MATNSELITQLYIGFYNRAPDPIGLEYWIGRLESGISIQDIGDSFAASPEASESYPFFSDPGTDIEGFLSQVYMNVFGRPIDADGLAYYSARLEAGEDPGSLVTSILGNADTNTGTPDQQYIQNKVDAGLYWVQQASESDVDLYLPNGRLNEAANDSAHGVIESVTSDPGTVEESHGGADDFFNPPIDVPPAEYGDLGAAATDGSGNLFVGASNPANGFMIGKDSSGQIELGLDVRYDNDGTDVAPDLGTNVFAVDADRGDAVRFAYSVSGVDLDHYDYTLQIDTDPGGGEHFETFQLVPDAATGASDDLNPSHYDWVRVDGDGIVDDGGDAGGTTTQNIQAIQWYNDNHGVQGAETYDVNLTATLKGTDTVVAETGIVIQSNEGSMTFLPSDAVAGNDDDHLFAGKTNPNDGFATVVSDASNIELGLTGWIDQQGAVVGVLNSEDGLLHYTLDNADTARFVYSVESQDADLLSANTFRLSIDTDASEATHYQVFELASLGETGNTADGGNISDSNYQWNHISGNGPAGSITDDGGDGIIGKITQNIEKVAWFDNNLESSAGESGHYDIMLEALGADGVTVVGMNHIVLDIGPVPV